MTIEIKNITVGSLFDQVCAGPRWSALRVFYNLNVPGYMNIKKKMLKILLCNVFKVDKIEKKIIRGALYELIIS